MRYSASTAKWLEICKKIKKYFVADNIGKISYLSPQNAITSNSEAKSIRLDVLAKDDRGISYDIEILFTDRHPCLSVNTSFAVRQNIAAA